MFFIRCNGELTYKKPDEIIHPAFYLYINYNGYSSKAYNSVER